MLENLLTQLFLPGLLGLIMFGMGLSLVKEDFFRLFKMPKPIGLGLLGQMILMPLLTFCLAIMFKLPTHLAVGLMMLAACPGGSMSNVFSHIARANLALSVTLTAISTVICVFSTPWIIQFAINYFSDQEPIQFSLFNTSVGLAIVTLLPIFLGLLVRAKWTTLALRWEPFFRRYSVVFMIIMVGSIALQDTDLLIASMKQVFWATAALNLGSIAIGIILGTVCHLATMDSLTLGIEVGVQNASMAILIAVSFLGEPSFATAAGVYGVTMYLGATLLVLGIKFARNYTSNLSVE